MALVVVTESNLDEYVAFLRDHMGDDAREFLMKIDARAAILNSGENYFCLRNAGRGPR